MTTAVILSPSSELAPARLFAPTEKAKRRTAELIKGPSSQSLPECRAAVFRLV